MKNAHETSTIEQSHRKTRQITLKSQKKKKKILCIIGDKNRWGDWRNVTLFEARDITEKIFFDARLHNRLSKDCDRYYVHEEIISEV